MTLPTSSFFDAERTREELDIDYAPSRFVPSLPAVIQDWGRRTKETKAAHAGRLFAEVSYGSHPRETIDLYRADSTSAPLLVFIHGGFWQAVSKEESGFVAGAWTKRGVHVAVLDYVLAPEVTLPTIVAQARKGLATLVAQAGTLGIDASRIVVSGHSAGGHLSAMSQIAHDAPVVPVAGLVLVSGVFELEPIRKSYVNDKVAMSAADAAALSPARFPPAHPLPLLVVVGEKEPTAFQEQSRLMAWNWKAQGCSTQMMLVPRRTHFDILDDLALPESALGAQTARLLKLA